MKIKYKKICESCQIEYVTTRENQKFCSNKCRRKQIDKVCPTCHFEFVTVPSVNQVFCSRKCIQRSDEYKQRLSDRLKNDFINSAGWFSGETLKKKNESCRKYRESESYTNPMLGKSRNKIWIQKYGEKEGQLKIQEYKEKCKDWSIFKKGQTIEERFGHDFAIQVRSLLSELRKQRRTSTDFDVEKHNYYFSVLKITAAQKLELLPNFDKRGKINRKKDAYHLDHIVSIKFGYDNRISPHYIGHIDNLRFIPALDNIKKRDSICFLDDVDPNQPIKAQDLLSRWSFQYNTLPKLIKIK